VEIRCLEVIRELSNYIDKDVTPKLREQILAHLPGCSHCTAVYNGLRNIITLTGDGRVFDLPAGFSQRLHAKLAKRMIVRLHFSSPLHSGGNLAPCSAPAGRQAIASANGPVKSAF
jgi:Putative zinc-finger